MIEIRGLTRSFGSVMAVNSVNLEIQQGVLFGLLGPNGAGKSTLINLICGLLRPDSGSVNFSGMPGNGQVNDHRAVKRMLGLVPQELAFYPAYSAAENVAFFAGLYGLRGAARRTAVARSLEITGLTDTGSKPAKNFSGGMKRRLNIACGLVHDPELIILDEPTVGIDPQSRNHILRSVEQLRDRGRTVIYTTHYMEEAENICTDIAIMDKGTIVARGSKDELKLLVRDAATVSFRLKRAAAVDLDSFRRISGVRQVEQDELVVRIVSDIGISNLNQLTAEFNRQDLLLADIQSDNPSLETVFLALTGRSLRD